MGGGSVSDLAADEEFTELVDADFPRVDLVGKGANGVSRFIVAKSDESSGMFAPEFVRDLIAKQDSAPAPAREQVTMPNGITLNGSPADIAAFIHGASVRPADPVAKAKYNADDRKKMAGSGAAMKDGSYPIADEQDLKNAIHAVGRGSGSHNAIRKHIISRAKSLGKSSLIPDNWNSDGSVKDSVSKEAGVPDTAVAKDTGDALDAATDDGVDGLDPTVPAAMPEDDAPGDPTDPGSSAWEAIDSATATKWCTIISGAKRAVCWLRDREALEAATADPDDAQNACDLDTVLDALDYAIGVLAPFAVSEQSESDRLAFEADVAKAAADPQSLGGAVVAIAKAGRVLSSANESRIRQASQHLNDVLASLPQALPEGGPAAVTKEEGAVPDTETPADDVAKTTAPETPATEPAEDVAKASPEAVAKEDAAAEQAPAAESAPEAPVAKSSPVTILYDGDGELLGVAPSDAVSMRRVAKAGDGEKQAMTAVFNQDGDLIGIVDPSAITPVAGAGGKKDAPADAEAKPDAGDTAPDGSDLEPQPSADAGTPAGAAGNDDDEDVAKGTQAPGAEENTPIADVLKSIAQMQEAITNSEAARQEAVAKATAAQAEEIEALKARLETVESMPAAPGVFVNGATPPSGERPVPTQLRGQDAGAVGPVDVTKARDLKQTLYKGDPAEQNAAYAEMQQMAIDRFTAMKAAGPQPF